MLACSNGHQSTVQLLLTGRQISTPPTRTIEFFWAVLCFVPFGVARTTDSHCICCRSGWNAMFDAAMNGDESIVRLLLASKADIHQKAPRSFFSDFFSDFAHLPPLHHNCYIL
jgi:hypothetical protein